MLRHLLILFLCLQALRAEDPLDLARVHIAALGGKERLDSLQCLRATARVSIGEQKLDLSIIAERPNHIRTETRSGGQLIIQAYDGRNPPWQYRGQGPEARKQPLSAAVAQAFVADADFLDPLADWVSRGSSLEWVGRVLVHDAIVLRIRIATTGRDLVEVCLDPSTYLITHQLRQRRLSPERSIILETHYSDYRPVAGVLLPHRIATYAEGRLLHVTELLKVTPNPTLSATCFAEP